MSDRTYPYAAWALTPGFKPKAINLIKCYGATWDKYDVSSTGKIYLVDHVYETQDAAIRAGLDKCDAQQADLHARQARLDKRRATLEKASNA